MLFLGLKINFAFLSKVEQSFFMNVVSPSHIPVLCKEVLFYLNPRENGYYVDATLGLGGHAEAIIRAVLGHCTFLGLDQDPIALSMANDRLKKQGYEFFSAHANYSKIDEFLAFHKIKQVDGMIADFGVSSYQLDDADRGFSFQKPGPIDMRMDPTGSSTAVDLIVNSSVQELSQILWNYGEERYAQKIATALKQYSKEDYQRMNTVDLARLIAAAVPRKELHKNPATRTFQALRLAVNRELDHLRVFIEKAIPTLRTGGRLICISFHSLEDRIVKWAFRHYEQENIVKIITPKPITPSAEEEEQNPRSRSAKMRVVEKI